MSGDGNPNGHNYSFHLKDCQTGIHVDGSSSSGIMFTRVEMENCENGIVVSSADGPVQLYGCEISARENAVLYGIRFFFSLDDGAMYCKRG